MRTNGEPCTYIHIPAEKYAELAAITVSVAVILSDPFQGEIVFTVS